jgi:hypothetical protein
MLAGCGVSYTVRLSASDIEQSLARKLPVSKTKYLVTATVRAVAVELRADEDKIFLRPEIDLGVVGRPALSGRALIEGQIRYAAEQGEFFFDRPKVGEVAIEGLPPSVRPVTEEVIAKLAEGYLATMPIYRLNPNDFKQSLAKLVLKSVKVHQGYLEVVLGTGR